jgi:hypothetical protein
MVLELKFTAARFFGAEGPKIASAYIAATQWGCDDDECPMLTSAEPSYEALKGQIDFIKATLDALLATAKARFDASGA